MFEKPEIIDAKTYETSLSVGRGLFRRRQIPAVVEARQLQPDKHAAKRSTTLGIISRISIGDAIRYDLTLRRGGNHKDLRLLQDNERICRADGTSITDIVTRGWNDGDSSSIVYAWYDRNSLRKEQPRSAEARMSPKVLLVGCYALHELTQAMHNTNRLPDNLALTNEDIKQMEASEHPDVYIEGISSKEFSQLIGSVYY